MALEWTDDYKTINENIISPGITVEESQQNYEKWGQKEGSYDKMAGDIANSYSFNAFKKAVKSINLNKDDLILDVGAGTGLTGQALTDIGFTPANLHGLEPVASFCDVLRKKGLFSKIFQQFIGTETPVDAPDNTYDAVVSKGCFGPGHIPATAILEMIRVCKPGGYVINCMRKEFLTIHADYRDTMVPLMEKLVSDKTWELVSWTEYEKHYLGRDGVAFIYRKC